MAKRQGPSDPHAAREAANYENPIASRELILSELERLGTALTAEDLALHFKIHEEEQFIALNRRLGAMHRAGQLLRLKGRRYKPRHPDTTVHGRVQGHKDGYGFVLREDDEDIFLANGQMRGVFDGDEVSVDIVGQDRKGRPEGRILEVLERRTEQLVGQLQSNFKGDYLQADSSRIGHRIIVEERGKASDGDYVLLQITKQPHWQSEPRGKVLEILGNNSTIGLATEVALRSHEVPHEWPEAALEQAQALHPEPAEADKAHRVDLRQLPLVTIDGEDARDFDDAVYCERKPSGGWRLWVAIADVSHYVGVGTALDQEAHRRATSVYFPDRVVPMLPEALSNGLCSLKPKVDRLCMVCEMTISQTGKLTGYKFYEAVMHSHARLTYTQVAQQLGLVDGEAPAEQKPLLPQLQELQKLYTVLRQARSQRGAIDFETVETRAEFDDKGKISAIVPIQRNDAHKLIEECMLAANVATARMLEKSGLDALFRVHEGPSDERLNNLRSYLGELGLNLGGGDKPSPSDYQSLLQSIAERDDASVIQTMMLRSLSQAVYQPENQGHFGLHYPAYAHFTSPIRRYPDLLVHRAIRYLIRSGEQPKLCPRTEGAKPLSRDAIYPYDTAAMLALGEHCSMAERRADDASRDVLAWLKCEFLEQHLGESFKGRIAAVTGFGMFVELDDLYIEGLVHISNLPQDYYQFDPAKQRLIGERSRRAFKLGDTVEVQVQRVSVEDRKIDLALTQHRSRNKAPLHQEPRGKRDKGFDKPKGKKNRSARKKLKSGAKRKQGRR